MKTRARVTRLDPAVALCYALGMPQTATRPLRAFVLICSLLTPAAGFAQRERQLAPPDESAYGTKFFDQLKSIFGKFRDADLQHAFQVARPIQCSELVAGKGEWRQVAFFNEDRRLGDWCRESIDEVKSDLSVFSFKGVCGGEQGSVRVSTEFPVGRSIEAYNHREISLDDVDVNVNAPVTAGFDSRTLAYTFELPYLFRTGQQGSITLYSFVAPTREDAYANEVTSRWECKAVKSDDVTYRFLICRTATVSRGPSARGQSREPAFGASAFFIMSDGTEAQTKVNLTFGGAPQPSAAPSEKTEPESAPARPSTKTSEKVRLVGGWQTPDGHAKVTGANVDGFRLRFNAQTWNGKIGSPQLLSDQKMSSVQSTRSREGIDYCVWRPQAADIVDGLLMNPPNEDVSYSMSSRDGSGQSAASIEFNMKTPAGIPIGVLQCYFPRTTSAASVSFDRWVSIVGGHLMLDVRQ